MCSAENVRLHPAVRSARADDVGRIRQLILELAAYEQSADQVRVTPDQLHTALFGPAPSTFCLVAETNAGEVMGFALYFLNFSTWEGVHGIYLEDLYVDPGFRGRGLGKALLQSLAALTVARGYVRFEWSVLDWNQPSIDFYLAAGAAPMADWTTYRLTGDALQAAAAAVGHP